MQRLADSLMDFAQTKLKIERVDVNNMIQLAIELVRTQKEFDGVEWDVQLDSTVAATPRRPGAAPAGAAQPVHQRRRRHAGCTGRPAPPQGALFLGRDARSASRFTVTDTGAGIAPRSSAAHLRSSVHHQGQRSRLRPLDLVPIVSNHGGKIIAESAPGEGATFTVSLPLEGPGSWH